MTDARLHPLVEAAAYFFVSEALTNVAKHASAQIASVRTHVDDGRLAVEVEDDGIGGVDPLGGSGLRGLDDRLQALDGRLEIEAAPHGGTLLRARLPSSRRCRSAHLEQPEHGQHAAVLARHRCRDRASEDSRGVLLDGRHGHVHGVCDAGVGLALGHQRQIPPARVG